MPFENPVSRLDLLFEDWLRFGLDGRLINCSKGLSRRILRGSPEIVAVYARELFVLDMENSESFFGAWVAGARGQASVLDLALKGFEESKHFLFQPVFSDGNTVTEIVVGSVSTPANIQLTGDQGVVRNTIGKLAEMKELFQDITRANKHLEHALKSAKIQMELAKSESDAKTEFLANMSHEIRTPMNAVIGFCDLLSNTDLSREQVEYVDAINQSGRLLIKLIGQVLDYSKIETGHLDLDCEALSLQQIILEIRAIMSARLDDKEIDFEVETSGMESLQVFGDETRVKQLLLNLLSNALKFTRRGKVALKVDASPSEHPAHHCIRARIEDTGIGIAPELVERLFDPFAQANANISKEYGGSGLGLAICKRLCNAMQGDVWVEHTELGEGSVFVFEIHLPISKTRLLSPKENMSNRNIEIEPEQTETRAVDKLKQTPLRVLVVDDNPNNLLITSKLSQFLGYEAETVRNGVDALEKMKESAFDIVLMDVRMSPLNGIEATRKIREGAAGEQCASAYIIAVTAHALEGDRERCLDSGMNDYLAKPLTLERLEESLNKARSELSLD